MTKKSFEFKDNHGRTWRECEKEEKGTIWNIGGQHVLCCLKYSHEQNKWKVSR